MHTKRHTLSAYRSLWARSFHIHRAVDGLVDGLKPHYRTNLARRRLSPHAHTPTIRPPSSILPPTIRHVVGARLS